LVISTQSYLSLNVYRKVLCQVYTDTKKNRNKIHYPKFNWNAREECERNHIISSKIKYKVFQYNNKKFLIFISFLYAIYVFCVKVAKLRVGFGLQPCFVEYKIRFFMCISRCDEVLGLVHRWLCWPTRWNEQKYIHIDRSGYFAGLNKPYRYDFMYQYIFDVANFWWKTFLPYTYIIFRWIHCKSVEDPCCKLQILIGNLSSCVRTNIFVCMYQYRYYDVNPIPNERWMIRIFNMFM
jgi:hypothetical protein